MENIPHFFLFCGCWLLGFSLTAQSHSEMQAVAEAVVQEVSQKGYRLSDHVIIPVQEFNMGYSTILFPGNDYLFCLTDDLNRKATIELGAKAQFDQSEIDQLFQQFKVGSAPEDLTSTQGASILVQELSLREVLIPIDYDFTFGMAEADIQADSKVNLLIFYKSSDNTSNESGQNEAEDYYQEEFKKLRAQVSASSNLSIEPPTTLAGLLLEDAANNGFSLASQQVYTTRDLPSVINTTLHGGNTYLLVLLNESSEKVQLIGTPDPAYNQLARLTEGMDPLASFETDPKPNIAIQKVDFRASLYSTFYQLRARLSGSPAMDSPISFFVFYKSYENLGGAEGNKAEDFYTQQAGAEMVHALQEDMAAYEKTLGYDLMSLEAMLEEAKNLSAISPSGLKYMNGKIAIDKWMEALVRESRGDGHLYKTFDAMHEDWQAEYASYQTTSTADSLLNELEGGVSHLGFTEDNLLVVDHVIAEQVVARYYFKIKRCADYGRIIPRQTLKDGKLHITPWQKVVVPN